MRCMACAGSYEGKPDECTCRYRCSNPGCKVQPSTDEMVAAVKAHAQEHYDDGGWDVIVECWDDNMIKDALVDEEGNNPETIEEAINCFKSYVSVYDDRQGDAAISSGEYPSDWNWTRIKEERRNR